MSKYRLNEYFSKDARRIAADLIYDTDHRYHDWCPVGIMLKYDKKELDSVNPKTPGALEAACALEHKDESARFGPCFDRVNAFLSDWDAGKIGNLREALDVPDLTVVQ